MWWDLQCGENRPRYRVRPGNIARHIGDDCLFYEFK